jgi:ATP-dependent DNA ligase
MASSTPATVPCAKAAFRARLGARGQARRLPVIVRRDGVTVRLFTRRGYDWTDRYPAIAVAAAKLKARSFTVDGEAVVCGADGVAVFDALHRRGSRTTAGRAETWRRQRLP